MSRHSGWCRWPCCTGSSAIAREEKGRRYDNLGSNFLRTEHYGLQQQGELYAPFISPSNHKHCLHNTIGLEREKGRRSSPGHSRAHNPTKQRTTPWKLGPQLRLDSGDYAGHYSSYDIHLSVHWAVTSQSQSVTSTVERSERSKGMPGSQTRAVAKLGLSLKCGES